MGYTLDIDYQDEFQVRNQDHYQDQSKKRMPQTPERHLAQLAQARRVMDTRFPNQSAKQRGEYKLIQALNWVYRWGWSSAKTIERVGGGTHSGLAARLVRARYLEATRTDSGLAQKDLPSHILTLTSDGLARVQRERDSLLPYSTDPSKVRQDQLRHYQIAQTATIEALHLQSISGYNVEKEMAELSADGVKQPDIFWRLPSGDGVAVEVELSGKWGRAMDIFVRGCVAELTAAPGKPARFDYLFILSDSNAILNRYKTALSAGSSYDLWTKDSQGHTVQIPKSTQKVPAEVAAKIVCRNSND